MKLIVVMLVAMGLLGAAVWGIFALLGHSNLRHYADVRAFVMTINMTIGMTIWMRIRGHGWRSTAETDGAMVLPFVLLIGPYRAGVVSGDAFIGVMHMLMLPFMLAVMVRRYEEYAGSHRGHSPRHVETIS